MSDNDNRYPRDGDEQVLLCDLTPKSLRQVHTVLAPYMYVVIISYFQNEHPDS